MNNNEIGKHGMTKKEYIDFLSNSSEEINMSNNNSKTGIACLNLAFPLCTCRDDAPCKQLCYANKGTQAMCNVQGAYYRNFRLYNKNPAGFFEQIAYKIKFSGLKMVRLFDSGDFPDERFLVLLCDLCEQFPEVSFMGFTKKYWIVNNYVSKNGKIPNNLNIMFSAWDRLWEVQNPYNLPVAYIKFEEERFNPVIPTHAFHCPGRTTTCSSCRVCWNKKVKAVYFTQH